MLHSVPITTAVGEGDEDGREKRTVEDVWDHKPLACGASENRGTGMRVCCACRRIERDDKTFQKTGAHGLLIFNTCMFMYRF